MSESKPLNVLVLVHVNGLSPAQTVGKTKAFKATIPVKLEQVVTLDSLQF